MSEGATTNCGVTVREASGGRWLQLDGQERAVLGPLLEALPAAIYATDAAGKIVFYNRCAAEFWRGEPELGVDEWCGPWQLLWPDRRSMVRDECPMAVALKEGHSIQGAEVIAIRRDGSEVRFLAYATPLYDRGERFGAVNMLVDVSGREPSGYFEQRLAAIVECSEDAIISMDLNGTITTWNPAAEQLFGYGASEVVGRPITVLIPADRLQEEAAILAKINRGERVVGYETVRQRKDGTQVDVSLTVSPLRDGAGNIVGASKIARNITERKRAQQYQNLLLKEMSHRVKNLLAIASGLIGLSARTAETPMAMAKAVQERLGAYSKAHELTRPEAVAANVAQRVSIQELVRTITSPYVDKSAGSASTNILVQGPAVAADGNAIPSLALALHEFTTNAAKYGALSVPGGRVHIVYGLADGYFELVWREEGGPAVAGEPEKSGFGTLLVSRTVQGQLGGTLGHQWKPEGVVITLRIPADRLAAVEG